MLDLCDTDRNTFLLSAFQAPTMPSVRPFVAYQRCRRRFLLKTSSRTSTQHARRCRHLKSTGKSGLIKKRKVAPSVACLSAVTRDNFQDPALLSQTASSDIQFGDKNSISASLLLKESKRARPAPSFACVSLVSRDTFQAPTILSQMPLFFCVPTPSASLLLKEKSPKHQSTENRVD
jgi:hypothetical protein